MKEYDRKSIKSGDSHWGWKSAWKIEAKKKRDKLQPIASRPPPYDGQTFENQTANSRWFAYMHTAERNGQQFPYEYCEEVEYLRWFANRYPEDVSFKEWCDNWIKTWDNQERKSPWTGVTEKWLSEASTAIEELQNKKPLAKEVTKKKPKKAKKEKKKETATETESASTKPTPTGIKEHDASETNSTSQPTPTGHPLSDAHEKKEKTKTDKAAHLDRYPKVSIPTVTKPTKGKWPFKANVKAKIPTLPALIDKERDAHQAFSKDEELFEKDSTPIIHYNGPHGYAVVVAASLRTLIDGVWLNDEIIAYMVMLSRMSNDLENQKNPDNQHNVLNFDSFFMFQLLQQGSEDDECEYFFSEQIKRILKKKTFKEEIQGKKYYYPPNHYDKIIFLCNLGNMHWCTFGVFPERRIIEAFDSLALDHSRQLKFLYLLMHDWYKAEWLIGKDKDYWKHSWELWHQRPNLVKQNNGYDCGLFCIQFIYALSLGASFNKITQNQTSIQRKRYLLWFLQQAKYPKLNKYVNKLSLPIFRPIDDVDEAHRRLLIDLTVPQSVFSEQNIWITHNKKLVRDFLQYANKEFAPQNLWNDIVERSEDWFSKRGLDYVDSRLPRTDQTLGEVLKEYESKIEFHPNTDDMTPSTPDHVQSDSKQDPIPDDKKEDPISNDKKQDPSSSDMNVDLSSDEKKQEPVPQKKKQEPIQGDKELDTKPVECDPGHDSNTESEGYDSSATSSEESEVKKQPKTVRDHSPKKSFSQETHETEHPQEPQDDIHKKRKHRQSTELPTKKNRRPPGIVSAEFGLGDENMDIPLPDVDRASYVSQQKTEKVYDYKDMTIGQKREFMKKQEFARLRDEYNMDVNKIDERMPPPPAWYDPMLDNSIDQNNPKYFWMDFVSQDKREEHQRKMSQAEQDGSIRGNTRAHKKELHEWKVAWGRWQRNKGKLIKQLDAEYNKKAREIYETVHQLNDDAWAKIRPLVEIENPDLRKTGKLYKTLKKMFPDTDYQKYTKEERERYREWKNGLSNYHLHKHQRNIQEVEQICRLQYIVPKNEMLLPFFQGQVARGEGFVTLKEKIAPHWVFENFNTKYVDLVKRAKGKFLPVPIGSATSDKAPDRLLSDVTIEFRQKDDNTCVTKGFASALVYLAKTKSMPYLHEAANAIVKDSSLVEGKKFKDALRVIHQEMEFHVPQISLYSKFNVKRKHKPDNPLTKEQLYELLTPYPTLVVPVGYDGSVSHAITVVDDLIFDSTQERAMKLSQQSLDWICGDCGCRAIDIAVRFRYPKNKQFRDQFNCTLKLNW